MNKKNLLIYGSGGAGRQLAFSLSKEVDPETPWNIKGFIDDNQSLRGKSVNGIPVLGGMDWLKNNGGSVAVCTVADPKVKRELVYNLKQIDNINFPLVIGPKSVVSPFVEWGEGCIVARSFNYISVNIKIGDFVFINCSSRIGHDAIIGEYTTIFTDVNISGGVEIGSDCVIGSGTTINPGVKIGNNCIVGAGAVVIKGTPDNVVVAGVPAKIIKEHK